MAVRPWQVHFPWATFAANAAACFLLGLLLGWQKGDLLSEDQRILFITGFCGGFSTYSTFTAESWGLWQSGHFLPFLLYAVGQFIACIGLLLLGLRVAG